MVRRPPDRHPFDFRFDGELPRGATTPALLATLTRTATDDQLVHSCAAAYASDMLLLSTSLAMHGTTFGAPDDRFASLDHAMWLHHAPFRADDWLYYDQQGSWADDGRAICQGRMFDPSGHLVVTVMREGMIRRRRTPHR